MSRRRSAARRPWRLFVAALLASGAIGGLALLLQEATPLAVSRRGSASAAADLAAPAPVATMPAPMASMAPIVAVRESDVDAIAPPAAAAIAPISGASVRALVLTRTGAPFTQGVLRIEPATLDVRAMAAFERHPRSVGRGSAAALVEPLGANGGATIVDVPLGIRSWVSVMHGEERIDRVTLEPLAEGEARELLFTIDPRIYVPVAVTRAPDGVPIEWPPGPDFVNRLKWSWTAAESASGDEIVAGSLPMNAPALELALPGRGQLHLRCRARGFEPLEQTSDVDDGSRLELRLVARRTVDLVVVDGEGRPFQQRWDDWQELGPGVEFLAGGDNYFAPGLDLGAWPVELHARPPFADATACFDQPNWPDERRFMPAWGVADRSRWRLSLPAAETVVGAFLDGVFSGSVIVPKEATTTTLAIVAPRPQTGSFAFEAIDGETRQPVAKFDVELHDRNPNLAGNQLSYRFDRPGSGRFEMPRLRAGRYQLEVKWRRPDVEDVSLDFEIRPGERTDLGTIERLVFGEVAIEVVDAEGRAVPRAEYMLITGTPLEEFGTIDPKICNLAWPTTDEQGFATLRADRGVHVVAVRAPGFAITAAELTVVARKKVVLRLRLQPK